MKGSCWGPPLLISPDWCTLGSSRWMVMSTMRRCPGRGRFYRFVVDGYPSDDELLVEFWKCIDERKEGGSARGPNGHASGHPGTLVDIPDRRRRVRGAAAIEELEEDQTPVDVAPRGALERLVERSVPWRSNRSCVRLPPDKCASWSWYSVEVELHFDDLRSDSTCALKSNLDGWPVGVEDAPEFRRPQRTPTTQNLTMWRAIRERSSAWPCGPRPRRIMSRNCRNLQLSQRSPPLQTSPPRRRVTVVRKA